MGDKGKPTLSVFQRVVLYGTPTVSTIACALLVCWVSQLQNRIVEKEASRLSFERWWKDAAANTAQTRQARSSDGESVDSFEYYLGKLAAVQVRQLYRRV